MKTPRWLLGSTLIAMATSFQPAVAVDTDEAGSLLEETDVAGTEAASYGRLRHLEGSISARRDGAILEALGENEPIGPGDEITTGPDGRVEIQLADGSSLKLDFASRVVLQALPDGSAELGDTTIIQVLEGSVIAHTQGMDSSEKRFQIDTAAASLFLLSNGFFRVDVRPDGTTAFSSRRGAAEATARDVSILVRSGQRISVRPGQQPGDPQVFNTRLADEFDLWADDADASMELRRRVDDVVPAGLPEQVQPYANELSYHGRWSHYPSYGWVWRPVGVVANWQPYVYGRWTRCHTGLFWVGYEPWGWAPYHYGRWEFILGSGWAWIPGGVFSGAYVSWSVAPGYFGWCPTGFYNYPVAYGFGYGVGTPWVYVNAHHVFERRINTVIIRDVTVIKEIERRCVVVRRPPRIDDRKRETAPHVAEELHSIFSRQPGRQVPEQSASRRVPFREQERARQVKLNTMRRNGQMPTGNSTPLVSKIPLKLSVMRPGEVPEGKVAPTVGRGIVARPASNGNGRYPAQRVQPFSRPLAPGQEQPAPKESQQIPKAQQQKPPQGQGRGTLEAPQPSQGSPRSIPRIIPPRKPREEVILERQQHTPPQQPDTSAQHSGGGGGQSSPQAGRESAPQAGRGQQKQRQREQAQKPKEGNGGGGNKDKKDKN